MKVVSTRIADVKVIEPKVFHDGRGLFFESYSERVLAESGLTERFVQDNHSVSVRGVVRGLHYQIQQAQTKLVRCIRGEIFDVAVDLRRNSPTFGEWVGEALTAENRKMLWIPRGFAHGFAVLSDVAELLYKASDFYAPKYERTILWNDPTIHVHWPAEFQPLVSGKDSAGLAFEQAEVYD